jgi:hypothetical protein
MRLFDRDTKRLATRVLAATVCAALAFAVLVQERHPKAPNLAEEERRTRGDLLLNATALSKVMGLNGKSTGEIYKDSNTFVVNARLR